MTILGLDPGTATTGYGIIEKYVNNLQCVAFGCIQTSAGLEPPARLQRIREQLTNLILSYRPVTAAVEQLFFTKNARTAISVAHARGVMLETLSSSRIHIREYTPLQVKQAITGYGKADKTQVQKMIKAILRLNEIPRPDDAADALAVAICCANSLSPYPSH